MRNGIVKLAVLLLVAAAIAAFGGFQVGKAASTAFEQPPAKEGRVQALTSVGQNLFGETAFHAHIGLEGAVPPVDPETGIVTIEIHRNTMIQAYVNVVDGDGTTSPCRTIYQLQIGTQGLSLRENPAVAGQLRVEPGSELADIVPCFCPETR